MINLDTELRRVENLPKIVYNPFDTYSIFAEDHNSLVDAIEELASKSGTGSGGNADGVITKKVVPDVVKAVTLINGGLGYQTLDLSTGANWGYLIVNGGNYKLYIKILEVDENGTILNYEITQDPDISAIPVGYTLNTEYGVSDMSYATGEGAIFSISEVGDKDYKLIFNLDNLTNDVYFKFPKFSYNIEAPQTVLTEENLPGFLLNYVTNEQLIAVATGQGYNAWQLDIEHGFVGDNTTNIFNLPQYLFLNNNFVVYKNGLRLKRGYSFDFDYMTDFDNMNVVFNFAVPLLTTDTLIIDAVR